MTSSSPFLQLCHDLRVHLQQEETAPFVFSETEEYQFFRTWALSSAKTAPPVLTRNISQAPAIKQPPKPHTPGIEEFTQLFQKIAPHIPLIREVPSDQRAEQLNRRWQAKHQAAPISLLTLQEPVLERQFLESLQTALTVSWAPTALITAEPIERDAQWDAFLVAPELKILILSESTLWQLPRLLSFYKEHPAQGTRSLGTIPVLLLSNLSMYLKNASLKRSLWTLLCQTIPPLLSV